MRGCFHGRGYASSAVSAMAESPNLPSIERQYSKCCTVLRPVAGSNCLKLMAVYGALVALIMNSTAMGFSFRK